MKDCYVLGFAWVKKREQVEKDSIRLPNCTEDQVQVGNHKSIHIFVLLYNFP